MTKISMERAFSALSLLFLCACASRSNDFQSGSELMAVEVAAVRPSTNGGEVPFRVVINNVSDQVLVIRRVEIQFREAELMPISVSEKRTIEPGQNARFHLWLTQANQVPMFVTLSVRFDTPALGNQLRTFDLTVGR